jgi:class 3 adenylate cyclase
MGRPKRIGLPHLDPDGILSIGHARIRLETCARHVNSAARSSSEAAAGKFLISESALAASGLALPAAERRTLVLKGRTEPMTVFVERPDRLS